MKKNLFATVVLSALILGTASTALAASQNPFSDIPKDHWTRKAVSELVHTGVIADYNDKTFKGNENITRFEMAKIVASAMASKKELSSAEKNNLDKLQAEFSGELKNLGVRVTELENKLDDNVKIHGEYEMEYLKSNRYGSNSEMKYQDFWSQKEVDSHLWEKILNLYIDAKVNDNWKVSAEIETEWWGDKFNAEKLQDQATNPATPYDSSLYKFTAEGDIMGGALQGQHVKIGSFEPYIQNALVTNARINGVELLHYAPKYSYHVLYGRVASAQWDLAPGNALHTYGDFSRNYDKDKMLAKLVQYRDVEHPATLSDGTYTNDPKHWTAMSDTYGSWGGDNITNAWGTLQNGELTDKRYFGIIYDYRFSPQTTYSLGYNRYTSAAYDFGILNIYSMTFNHRFSPLFALAGGYAHGNQGGQDNTYNLELDYKGAPWVNPSIPHNFGMSIAYRYLGSDSIIKTGYSNGISAGQKGFEINMAYAFDKNIVGSVFYGKGKALWNNADRSKITSVLYFFF